MLCCKRPRHECAVRVSSKKRSYTLTLDTPESQTQSVHTPHTQSVQCDGVWVCAASRVRLRGCRFCPSDLRVGLRSPSRLIRHRRVLDLVQRRRHTMMCGGWCVHPACLLACFFFAPALSLCGSSHSSRGSAPG